MTAERRRAMGDAAVAAAKAIGYAGAGTVEFIVDEDGAFYFMEMNTRLQVEHPVTEMITGVDLVEWQLRIAAGEPLPRKQDELAIDGHAVEGRIYAEDPARGFLPSVGTLVHLRLPQQRSDLRIDAGVREGDAISPFYDAMIAKLVAHGADRAGAVRKLAQALAEFEIAGVATNIALLRRLVAHDDFAHGAPDTGLIARHSAELVAAPDAVSWRTLLAAALAEVTVLRERACVAAQRSSDPYSPWHAIDPWWPNNPEHALTLTFGEGDQRHDLALRRQGSSWRVTLPRGIHDAGIVAQVEMSGKRLSIVTADEAFAATVVPVGNMRHVFCHGDQRMLTAIDPLAHSDEHETHGGHLTAPMSGVLVAVMVKAGDDVSRGSPLMVLEAMKMEHTIVAPADGTVRAVHYAAGERVNEGADLVDIDVSTLA
jgi:3-methylcrotonyl-CoA carboxylase alpha subunit